MLSGIEYLEELRNTSYRVKSLAENNMNELNYLEDIQSKPQEIADKNLNNERKEMEKEYCNYKFLPLCEIKSRKKDLEYELILLQKSLALLNEINLSISKDSTDN